MKIFGKINTIIMKIFWYISILIFVAMLIILSIQVIGRFFGFGLSWSEEFGRYGQIVIVNLGASLVMFDDSHISMSFLEDILPAKGKHVIKLIRYIAMIVFGCTILYLSRSSLELASRSVSSGMQIPMTVIYAVYPVMSVAMIIHGVYLLCLNLKKEPPKKEEVTE